jgi:predicted PurR-regulated permease PerM
LVARFLGVNPLSRVPRLERETRVLVTKRRIHWGRIIFYTVAALVAVWLAWAARSIWFPVAIAFILAVVLDPVVDRVENRGIPRAVATTLVFIFVIGAAALAIVLLSPSISAQAQGIAHDLSRLFPDPEHPDLVPVTKKILDRLDAHPALRDALVGAARAGTARLSDTLQKASVLALAWAPNLMWFIVVPVLAFYTLNDFHRIYAKGILLVARQHRPFAQSLVAELSAVFGKYLRGLAQVCTLLGIGIALLLWAMGNPYWGLLGLMGGLFYAIPVVGSLFTLALVTLVAYVTGPPGKAALTALFLVLLTNGLFDQWLTPRIVGKQVGLHPILTILALLVGYQVWGILGMLVAVPLAACVQTIIVHLIPKLGADMDLKPLEELQKTEEQLRAEKVETDTGTPHKAVDEHARLQVVVESAESAAAELDEEAAEVATAQSLPR